MKEKEQIFLELLEPQKAKLWRFCLSISKTRDNALDLLQDSLEKAFLHFDQVKAPEAFLSYLFTIATRLNIKNQKGKVQSYELDEQLINSLVSRDASPEDRMEIIILYESLEKLKYEQKEAIILSEINGFSHSEAAEIQGISLDAFRKRLYRAKNALREIMLPKEEYTDEIHNNLNYQANEIS